MRMGFYVVVVALLVYIAALLIPDPAAAAGWDVMRSGQRYSECRECIPPQVDALILRPPALLVALPLGLAAFTVAAPFTALGDVAAVPTLFDALVGDTARFVFADPLGSHR